MRDLTRPIIKFLLWMLTGLNRTLGEGASGHLLSASGQWHSVVGAHVIGRGSGVSGLTAVRPILT
jgi:hypothetical protein